MHVAWPGIVALGLVGMLAACAPMVGSDGPLLTAGGSAPSEGVWAVLEDGCAAPSDARVQAWPECATPIWIEAGRVTIMTPGPVRSDFVVTDGDPRVVRFADRTESPPRYTYYAFKSDPGAREGASVWALTCSAVEDEAGVAHADGDCSVSSEAVLRRLASRLSREAPTYRAVYVGPA